MSSFNLTFDEHGIPIRESCKSTPFYMFYNTPEVVNGFERLYHNIDGYQDKFFQFWAQVVQRFKGVKTVVGYDVLNEPALAN